MKNVKWVNKIDQKLWLIEREKKLKKSKEENKKDKKK